MEGIHPNAMPAHKAAYCAGQQAPKLFWELHDWLFANQKTWSSAGNAAEIFRNQALKLGVDAAGYDTCLANSATEDAMRFDMADASSKGIRSTPSFIIEKVNAQGVVEKTSQVTGAVPYEQLAVKLEQLLRPPAQ